MKQSEIKGGDVVEIYEDPVTRKRLEGKAIAIYIHCKDTGVALDWHFEDWQVQFVGDGPDDKYRRRIRIDH